MTGFKVEQAFDGVVLASAIVAADQMGLLATVRDQREVLLARFASDHGLDDQALNTIVDVLERATVLASNPEEGNISRVVEGKGFDGAWNARGYLAWLLLGYGTLLARAADAVQKSVGSSVLNWRDGAAIAAAGKVYGEDYVDPIFDELIASCRFTTAMDLGCGSGNRILRLAERWEKARFIGVDIDPGAVLSARQAVSRAGLQERITIVQADVETELARDPSVELLLSSFMAHDLLPRDRMHKFLCDLRSAYPNATRLLIADTCRSTPAAPLGTTLFASAFEYTHGLMRQSVPTLEEWVRLFAESPSWSLQRVHPLGIPNSFVFDLVVLERAGDVG